MEKNAENGRVRNSIKDETEAGGARGPEIGSENNDKGEKGKACAEKKPGLAMRNKRLLFTLAFLVVLIISLVFQTGTGTISAFGIGAIQAICPLGAIEAAIASKTIVPVGVLGLLIVVAVVLITGKAFCAWLCPTNLVKRLFALKSPAEREAIEAKRAAGRNERKTLPKRVEGGEAETAARAFSVVAVSRSEGDDAHGIAAQSAIRRRDDAPDPERGGKNDSRNWVLGGAIVGTALFGFPIFCLVCPVGLTCASVIAIWRAFQLGETTWSLLVFPLLLILELVVFRRWCHSLCPIGALVGFIARGNRTFRVTLDHEVCLKDSCGISCGRCSKVCPEGIDLHEGALTTPRNECVKCGECSAACPVHAITFPFLPKRNEAQGNEGALTASAHAKGPNT